jgi:hypothetical protein
MQHNPSDPILRFYLLIDCPAFQKSFGLINQCQQSIRTWHCDHLLLALVFNLFISVRLDCPSFTLDFGVSFSQKRFDLRLNF